MSTLEGRASWASPVSPRGLGDRADNTGGLAANMVGLDFARIIPLVVGVTVAILVRTPLGGEWARRARRRRHLAGLRPGRC